LNVVSVGSGLEGGRILSVLILMTQAAVEVRTLPLGDDEPEGRSVKELVEAVREQGAPFRVPALTFSTTG
jgi:hypothetical protein